jgi:hypothetical protein
MMLEMNEHDGGRQSRVENSESRVESEAKVTELNSLIGVPEPVALI